MRVPNLASTPPELVAAHEQVRVLVDAEYGANPASLVTAAK
ncbi:hypothetical protein [Hymenobacter cheonanensis]|nr:hypothetical protein [Hymenobacter sp. CA2-7]MDO7886099.1 hypothetical protein [Hymenobacter sp. CA2-7]